MWPPSQTEGCFPCIFKFFLIIWLKSLRTASEFVSRFLTNKKKISAIITFILVLVINQYFLYFKNKAANTVTCYQPKCTMTSHIICLADKFLSRSSESTSQILPVEGPCPRCLLTLQWGDVIRHKHGCYQNLDQVRQGTSTAELLYLWRINFILWNHYVLCGTNFCGFLVRI